MAALNAAMADKDCLVQQITDVMEAELLPVSGGSVSLGGIERRLNTLEQQFQDLLEKAAADPSAYESQFKEILDEQTRLKKRRSAILADNKEQDEANRRLKAAAEVLKDASPYITEWNEGLIRQLVTQVKILSKKKILVTIKGGIEVREGIVE